MSDVDEFVELVELVELGGAGQLSMWCVGGGGHRGWVTKQWRSDYEAEGRSQAILNTYWPPPAVSRRLPDRDHWDWIEVEVRVVWEVDGEEWVPGTATKWWRRHVFVKIGDRRLLPQGTWLAAHDVRRAAGDD